MAVPYTLEWLRLSERLSSGESAAECTEVRDQLGLVEERHNIERERAEAHWMAVAHVTMGLAREMYPTRRTFVRSPGFETPTETWSWLFEQGVQQHDGHVEQGPDGLWRGSGEVTG